MSTVKGAASSRAIVGRARTTMVLSMANMREPRVVSRRIQRSRAGVRPAVEARGRPGSGSLTAEGSLAPVAPLGSGDVWDRALGRGVGKGGIHLHGAPRTDPVRVTLTTPGSEHNPSPVDGLQCCHQVRPLESRPADEGAGSHP